MKFVEIESIATREVTNETVYDIQLSENHYFSANNIITHNCRLKNKLTTKEFTFTNGNVGISTGSKSVITLNLSRITQDWALTQDIENKLDTNDWSSKEFENKIN